MENVCKCGNELEWYGVVGQYSKSCKPCNQKNAERQRIARAKDAMPRRQDTIVPDKHYVVDPVTVEFIGIHFIQGKQPEIEGLYLDGEFLDKILQVRCPCGRIDTFPLNGIPTVNMPQSCGARTHWAVKYN